MFRINKASVKLSFNIYFAGDIVITAVCIAIVQKVWRDAQTKGVVQEDIHMQ